MQEDLFSTYCGYLQFILPTSLFTFFSSLPALGYLIKASFEASSRI
jgi:hypothetical protein